jgi:quercetin dioxygenase-like cupin family protein
MSVGSERTTGGRAAADKRLIVRLDQLEQKALQDNMGHIGGRIWEVFTAATVGAEAVRLLVQEYPPGGYTEGHPIHNDFEQMYYILSGTMNITLDGETFPAPEGSFVFIPRGTRHEHRNDGPESAVFLTVNVPVRDGSVPPLRSD